MSLYSYKVFNTVVREGSFARAAKALDLTPSAISHTIAKLEDEFGFRLFVRGKKEVTLTDSGRQVEGYISEIIASSGMLEKRVDQINGARVGEVNFGVIDSVAVSWLPKILENYREEFPDIEVNVQEDGYNNIINAILSHELDLAIVSHSSIRNLGTPLQFIPLHEDKIVCVVPDKFRPKNRDHITVEELAKMRLIFQPNGDDVDIEEYFEGQGVSVDVRNTAITNTSLTSMVKCGLGAGILAQLSLSCCDLTGLSVYPIVPFGARTLGIISRDKRFLTAAAGGLASCITDLIN